MKRVLVTGGTGFIGTPCLPLLLAKGYEVHAVSSKEVGKDSGGCYWYQVNLLDSSQVSELMEKVKPSHLLHLAWYAVPGKYWTSLENFRWVQASLHLLQEFRRNGGQRVVIAGTCAEYDWNYGYCSEQVTPLLPSTVYGICKNSLQNMVLAFAKQVEMSAAWGRIFFAYGDREPGDRLVPYVIRSLLQGKTARCSHGNQIRDFLYVKDVADAFVTLLESQVVGALNIASGKPVALKDIIENIAQKLNRPEAIELGAIRASANDPPLLVADIRRLTREVGWQPTYDLTTGLEETMAWWKTREELISVE
ncbi:NAD-dependent epimerase/dehydratase family protein [Phormidium sp. CCY1219]|uniref:NAD-dependent epimerase/dehydratase family protein n=1 Tax=Phormidium sp. CCY1219 TaxID=2886104 RepID=UPI002D1E5800|nr:NAD(P)-dependent oxidoreductase [Phormidium sp. CCY1219]MEB3830728.1 NAD(P)-dependent oxidoreductase [Phormidium sp. CCY1219]